MVLSAAVACTSSSLVSQEIDNALILNELQFYREQFGVSEEMLHNLSPKVHPDKREMMGVIIRSESASENIAIKLSEVAHNIFPQEYVFAIRMLILGGKSFATTYNVLNGYLDKFEKISNDNMKVTLEEMMDAVKLD